MDIWEAPHVSTTPLRSEERHLMSALGHMRTAYFALVAASEGASPRVLALGDAIRAVEELTFTLIETPEGAA